MEDNVIGHWFAIGDTFLSSSHLLSVWISYRPARDSWSQLAAQRSGLSFKEQGYQWHCSAFVRLMGSLLI